MTAAAPLFDVPLPKQRKTIDGFPTGCRVAFDCASREKKGTVIATLPKYQWVVIRSDDIRIHHRSPADVRRID